MIWNGSTWVVLLAGLLLLPCPSVATAEKSDKATTAEKDNKDDQEDKDEKDDKDEKSGAEETVPVPVEVTGKIYKGRRLQPKREFFFIHDLPEKTGTRSSRKKKSAIAKTSARLDSDYKQYKEKQRHLEKLYKDREEERRKITEEYRTQPTKATNKSLKDALKDLQSDYERRIESARSSAQNEAEAFQKQFEDLAHEANTGGSRFIACTSDAGGNFKATLPQPGTYYIFVPEAISLGDGEKGLLLFRIPVKAGEGELTIELKPEYVFEKNIKF